MYVTLLMVSPPNEFEIAVVLRTLYTMLSNAFELHVYGEKPLVIERVLRYSRVPARVLRERMHLHTLHEVEQILKEREVVLVDPNEGQSIEVLDCVENPVFAVCYDERILERFRDRFRKVVRVRVLGLDILSYECIAVIYGYAKYVCRYFERGVACRDIDAELLRDAVYIGRKVLESISWFDNNAVLEPSAVVAVVNKALRKRSLRMDLIESMLRIDHIRGSIEQVFRVEVSRIPSLEEVCKLEIVFDGSKLLIPIPFDARCRDVRTLCIDLRVGEGRFCLASRCFEISPRVYHDLERFFARGVDSDSIAKFFE